MNAPQPLGDMQPTIAPENLAMARKLAVSERVNRNETPALRNQSTFVCMAVCSL